MLERGDKSFHTNYFMNWTTRTVSTLKSKNEQNVSVQGNWIKNGYLVKQWARIILDTPWILTVRSLKQLKAHESTHRTITFLILLVMTLPLYKKQNVVYCNYNTKLGIKHPFMSIEKRWWIKVIWLFIKLGMDEENKRQKEYQDARSEKYYHDLNFSKSTG